MGPKCVDFRLSAASYTHVSSDARPADAPINDEIVPFRLHLDSSIDGHTHQVVVYRGSERTAEVRCIFVSEAGM